MSFSIMNATDSQWNYARDRWESNLFDQYYGDEIDEADDIDCIESSKE